MQDSWMRQIYSLVLLNSGGEGKSQTDFRFSSSIIKDLESMCDKVGSHKLLVSWYFQFNEKDSKDLTLSLKDFMRQLGAKDRLPRSVMSDLKEAKPSFGTMEETTLIELLEPVIRNLERDIFLVVDGLDELVQANGPGDAPRRRLLELIASLALTGYDNLHILIISKDQADIRQSFEKKELSSIVVVESVQGELEKEIDNFVDTVVKLDWELKSSDPSKGRRKLRGDLQDKIKKRLKGEEKVVQKQVFLWSSYQNGG